MVVGGGWWWWLRPILVFSLSLDQAEQLKQLDLVIASGMYIHIIIINIHVSRIRFNKKQEKYFVLLTVATPSNLIYQIILCLKIIDK